ncbi:MAG: MBL fold metallo-hydrolase [Eubacteriales bacterium]|nr:MBL fold metallo-hydrolase [Eubacteriales bacterium]
MKLIMLGTGNAMVTKCYNTCFALENEDAYFLVDAGGGNGIFHQMEGAKIPFEKIHHMFVTHGHTDHILGVFWVMRKIATLMAAGSYEGEMVIYGHDEVMYILKEFSALTFPGKIKKYIGTQIRLQEVKEGETVRAAGMQVQFFDIGSTKLKQFGFTALLPDGQKLACLGDEPYKERNQSYVQGADWLLCEAFCLYEDRERFKPYEKHHSTALDAGRLAETLGVKNLVLYHTEDKTLATRKERYTFEAAREFHGTVYVPEDLESIEL